MMMRSLMSVPEHLIVSVFIMMLAAGLGCTVSPVTHRCGLDTDTGDTGATRGQLRDLRSSK